MKYIIKEQECGYLLKNGRFQSFLAAGSCHYIKAMGYELKIDRSRQHLRDSG